MIKWLKRLASDPREDIARIEAELDLLACAKPGGTVHTAIIVATSAVIEARAAKVPCHRCEAPVEVAEHLAERSGRVAITRCPSCGATRRLHFRVARAA
jgi:hypothetical protein